MDFIIGMFLFIFFIVAILNFATISISDSPNMTGQCNATSTGSGQPGIAGTLLGNMFGSGVPMSTMPMPMPVPTMGIPGSNYNQIFF